jgi:hypothetical protein
MKTRDLRISVLRTGASRLCLSHIVEASSICGGPIKHNARVLLHNSLVLMCSLCYGRELLARAKTPINFGCS